MSRLLLIIFTWWWKSCEILMRHEQQHIENAQNKEWEDAKEAFQIKPAVLKLLPSEGLGSLCVCQGGLNGLLGYLVLLNPSHPKHACRMCYCCCLQVHLQATSTFTNKLWQLDRQNPGKTQKEKKSMSSTAQLFKITALRALTHVFVRRSFIWFGQVEH